MSFPPVSIYGLPLNCRDSPGGFRGVPASSSLDGSDQPLMQLGQLVVKGQPLCTPGKIPPQRRSSHSLPGGLKRQPSRFGDEGMKIEIRSRETVRIAGVHRAPPLLDRQVQIQHSRLALPMRGGLGGKLPCERPPKRVEFVSVGPPTRYPHHAGYPRSVCNEGTDSVAYLHQADIRQRRQRLAHDRQTDLKFACEGAGGFKSLTWPYVAENNPAANLVRRLHSQRPPTHRLEVGGLHPPIQGSQLPLAPNRRPMRSAPSAAFSHALGLTLCK